MTTSFLVEGDHFIRNGAAHRILSGALHYFRVVPEYWEDRLLKYRACGLNTVETYIAWNLHEPSPGNFCFEGMLDLRRFIKLAGSLGLDVILRPGPYICAEWDLGGLPAWLLADPGMRLRSLNPQFLVAVERYLTRLFEEVGDLQCHLGGPIIAVQVENEYGSYGTSRPYLEWNEKALCRNGVEVLLFTSDGPEDSMLQGGTLPRLLKTVNFGSQGRDAFKKLATYQPQGPQMCMEFWNGWFDHWGEPHHSRDAADAAAALEEILSSGASVNIYMMHGGTNFGFLNGANHDGLYHPTVTSYDYDAPINEQGHPTEKYYAFRDILARHGACISGVPPTAPTRSYGAAEITDSKPLFEALQEFSEPIQLDETATMEEVGQNYGYILYRTHISGPRPESKLFIQEVRDRALVFQDGDPMGIIYRNDTQAGLPISVAEGGSRLDILVENLGRVNYGPQLHDRKGITHGVRLNNQYLSPWEIHPLDLTQLPTFSWSGVEAAQGPTFYRSTISIEAAHDTFLKVTGRHGAAWINGFCLGRYWEIGPQKALYVPASLLRQGGNEIVILELEQGEIPAITLEALLQ